MIYNTILTLISELKLIVTWDKFNIHFRSEVTAEETLKIEYLQTTLCESSLSVHLYTEISDLGHSITAIIQNFNCFSIRRDAIRKLKNKKTRTINIPRTTYKKCLYLFFDLFMVFFNLDDSKIY